MKERLLAEFADDVCSVADHLYVTHRRADYNAGRISIVELICSISKYAIAEPHLALFSSDPDAISARKQYFAGVASYTEAEDVFRNVAIKLSSSHSITTGQRIKLESPCGGGQKQKDFNMRGAYLCNNSEATDHFEAFELSVNYLAEQHLINKRQLPLHLIGSAVWDVMARDLPSPSPGNRIFHSGNNKKRIHLKDPFARFLSEQVTGEEDGAGYLDRHIHPQDCQPGAGCAPFDPNSLFGADFVNSVIQRLDHFIDNPATIYSETKGCDPIEVSCILFLFEWIYAQERKSRDWDDPDPWREMFLPQFARALLLSPLWVRPLREWQPSAAVDFSGNVAGLLAHLFVVYPVPDMIVHECGKCGVGFHIFLWFILIGRGASLSRIGKNFGWHVPKGFIFSCFKYHSSGTPSRQTRYIEARRIGAREEVAELISDESLFDTLDILLAEESKYAYMFPASNTYGLGDLNWTGYTDPMRKLYSETTLWLERHWDEIVLQPVGTVNRIFAWMRHETYDLARENGYFSWKNRRLNQVLNETARYEQFLEEQEYEAEYGLPDQNQHSEELVSCSWNGKGWNWCHAPSESSRWEVCELLTGADLLQEGAAMHHCVGSSKYIRDCVAEKIAVLSVRKNNQRVATLEIQLKTREITQMLGVNNNTLSSEIVSIITLWKGAKLKEV